MKTKLFSILLAVLLVTVFASSVFAANPVMRWHDSGNTDKYETIDQGDSIDAWYYVTLDDGFYNIKLYNEAGKLVSVIKGDTSSPGGEGGIVTVDPNDYKTYGTFQLQIYGKDVLGPETWTLELTVICTDSDNDGVCDDDEKPFTDIEVTATPDNGDAPLEVQFGCNVEGGNSPLKYVWDFGDGQQVVNENGNRYEQNPIHTYEYPGRYTASCKAKDSDNDMISGSVTVKVSEEPENNAPVALFTAYPIAGFVPHEVDFDASESYDSDGTIVSYEWYVDGTYAGSGKYFDYTFTKEGNYIVKLRVTDDDGATDHATETIYVKALANQKPVAIILADPMTGYAPLDVDFDGSTSYDHDGTLVSYSWAINGPVVSNNAIFDYTFNEPGSYVVALTVTDDDGRADTESVTIIVKEPVQENRAPVALFDFDPENPEVFDEIIFDGTDSYDTDGDNLTYAWDFDNDGVTDSTSSVATYVFDAVGTYSVTLTVNDGELSDSVTKNVIVKPKELIITDLVCFGTVVVNHKQSCGVHVEDTDGNSVEDATVDIFYNNTDLLFGTCTTMKNGDCRTEQVMTQVGEYAVIAKADKENYVVAYSDSFEFEVIPERYGIRDLKVYEDVDFTQESYDFYRGENIYVEFQVYELTTGDVITNDIVTKATLVSQGDETADLDEIGLVNEMFRFELLPIPYKYDFIGNSQVFTFAFNYTDGTGGQQEVDLIIRNNIPLIFPELENLTLVPGQTFTYDLNNYEFDLEDEYNAGDQLSWLVESDSTIFDATLNDKILTITANTVGQDSFDVTLVDYDDDTDSQTVTVIVKEDEPENQPPVLGAIGNKVVYEGDNLQFTITAYDPDGDDLDYSLVGLPNGAVFDHQVFYWNPQVGDAGEYTLTFSVSDGEYSDSETITITVKKKINPQELNAVINGPFSEYPFHNIRFDASGSSGDIVIYHFDFGDGETLETNVPKNHYHQYNGEEDSYTVTLTVYDDNGNSDTDTTTVTMLEKDESEKRTSLHANIIDVYGLYSAEDYVVQQNDELVVGLTLSNAGDIDLKDVHVTAIIPDLGVKQKTETFRLDEGERKTRHLFIPIYDAPPGEYYVKLVIGNFVETRTKYRYFIVE